MSKRAQTARIAVVTSPSDLIERAEEEITEQYLTAIKPPSPPPAPQAQPERAALEWEKDKIELAEFKHAKKLLRSREFPPYFDTEEGMLVLFFFRTGKRMIITSSLKFISVLIIGSSRNILLNSIFTSQQKNVQKQHFGFN